jgi:hypothetical protein
MTFLGLPLETAIIAALIGVAGALLVQIVGQVLGALIGTRWAARLARKTQLEIAELTFARQWRETLVRPYMEFTTERVRLLHEFNERLNDPRGLVEAEEIARRFARIDTVLHNASVAALEVISVSGGLSVSQEAQADECAGEVQEGEDRGGMPVVPDGELAKGDDPCLRALDDPPDPSQALTRFHAPPRDPWSDPRLPQRALRRPEAVALVSSEPGWPLAWPSWLSRGRRMGWTASTEGLEQVRVVYVASRKLDGQRHPRRERSVVSHATLRRS